MRRRVVITLPPEAYRHLAGLAEAEERGIDQQASLLLKRVLMQPRSDQTHTPPVADECCGGVE